MARQASEEFDDTDAEIHAWLTQWWQERSRYLSHLVISIAEPLGEGQKISAVVHSHRLHRDALGCYKEVRYRGGYELPICLLQQTLTQDLADRLQTTLSEVKDLQGLDFTQGFAMLVHFFLIIVDLSRARHEGKPSILFGPTWGQIAAGEVASDQVLRPIWRLETVFDYWTRFGGGFARGLAKSPDGCPGKPSYLTIPPRWVYREV